jgi:hypothetical protein
MSDMRASAIIRVSVCVLVALGLLGASGAAASAGKVGKKEIVIATFGKRGVELVGADHQARRVTLRHRAKRIRPGSIVRYHKSKKAAAGKTAASKSKIKPIPVVIVNHAEHVGRARGTSVYGVVTKADSVRLADGKRIGGETVKAAVADLRPGAPVAVSLRFSQGRTQVRSVKPKPSKPVKAPKPPRKKPAPTVPAPAPAPAPATSGPWWMPTASAALPLHWILDGTASVGDAVSMGGSAVPLPAVYDLDGEGTSKSAVDALHALGKKVICYVDAGTYESYRSDAAGLQAISGIYGSAVQGWPGEYWLDVRRITDLAPIMQARFQNCKNKGFDAIEPDNIDGWSNSTGFPLTGADQIAYNRALAQWAHAMGMSIGLKNDLEQVPSLVGDFDWALNEECYDYNECSSLAAFTQANKAVWIAQYQSLSPAQCADSLANHFNTATYQLDLSSGGSRTPCPETW